MRVLLLLLPVNISLLALLGACQADNDHTPPELRQVWTWISGSDTSNQAGVYGTKGVASPSNVPGARYEAASWTDPGGRLWVFGGEGLDSTGFFARLNDLWKFDPGSNEWTWVSGNSLKDQSGTYGTKGVAAPANVPGARYAVAAWTNPAGGLWLFGGKGFDSAGAYGELNDLWRFDPTALEWTWVSGSDGTFQPGVYGTKGVAAPANVPGARSFAAAWAGSSGSLWLFGGTGWTSALPYSVPLNDLWRFDPSTLEWTWVSGGSAGAELGVYGIKGQSDPSNVPGARNWSTTWTDPQGNLWLFGGWGPDVDDETAEFNDLWRFDPTTLEWTWVHGGNAGDLSGIYGTKGTAAPANTPGSRHSALSWLDLQGKLWLFGGFGLDVNGTYGELNDLWRFDPVTLEWAWISGRDVGLQAGNYGTKGTAAFSSFPGARGGSVSWIDPRGRLWLFGGYGHYSTGNAGYLNDLWRYTR